MSSQFYLWLTSSLNIRYLHCFCVCLCSTQRSSSEHHLRGCPVQGEFEFLNFHSLLSLSTSLHCTNSNSLLDKLLHSWWYRRKKSTLSARNCHISFLSNFKTDFFNILRVCTETTGACYSNCCKHKLFNIYGWFSRFLHPRSEWWHTIKLWHCHQSTVALWWSGLILLIDVINQCVYVFPHIPNSFTFPLFAVHAAHVNYEIL